MKQIGRCGLLREENKISVGIFLCILKLTKGRKCPTSQPGGDDDGGDIGATPNVPM